MWAPSVQSLQAALRPTINCVDHDVTAQHVIFLGPTWSCLFGEGEGTTCGGPTFFGPRFLIFYAPRSICQFLEKPRQSDFSREIQRVFADDARLIPSPQQQPQQDTFNPV